MCSHKGANKRMLIGRRSGPYVTGHTQAPILLTIGAAATCTGPTKLRLAASLKFAENGKAARTAGSCGASSLSDSSPSRLSWGKMPIMSLVAIFQALFTHRGERPMRSRLSGSLGLSPQLGVARGLSPSTEDLSHVGSS